MTKISEDYLDSLKAAASDSIVDIIDRRVKLTKTGKNYSACCPFHEEKTPSFVVSPDKGTYHCFGGCGGGGGTTGLDFIMAYERLSLPEAVKMLARELNMEPVVYQESNAEKNPNDNQEAKLAYSMKAALVSASSIYSENLGKSPDTLRYLLSRGVTPNDIRDFKIGYAEKSFKGITNALTGRYTDETIFAASLSKFNEEKKSKHDCFFNRLMFPIRNIKGEIIGFGGRRLDNEKNFKYINSAESIIFKKSKVLYGLFEAISMPSTTVERGVFNITEGYLDVISAHRNGFTNTVAPMGTALSDEQVKMLFQRCDKIRLIQDGDAAGIEAIKRSIRVAAPFLTPNKTCTAVILPDGEDVDSILSAVDGAAHFKRLIDKELPVSEFIVDYLISKNAHTAEGHARVASEVNEIIALIQDQNLQMTMRATLHRSLGITQAPPVAVTSAEDLFAKLPAAHQNAIKAVSKTHCGLAGLILSEPAWVKLLRIDQHAKDLLPKAAQGLIDLALGAGVSAKNNKNHPAHGVVNYLVAATPASLPEQIALIKQHNDWVEQTFSAQANPSPDFFGNEDDLVDAYESYARSTQGMSSH